MRADGLSNDVRRQMTNDPHVRPASSADHDFAARARAWVERTCKEQGIPVKISDPLTIQKVAAIFRSAREQREGDQA
jgi:hypothetical protein